MEMLSLITHKMKRADTSETDNDVHHYQKEDESDDERDLTNLTWLTELRNQTISWSNAIVSNIDEQYNQEEHEEEALQNEIPKESSNSSTPALRQAISNKSGCSETTEVLSKFSSKCTKTLNTSVQMKKPSPVDKYEIFMNKIKRDSIEYELAASKYQSDVSKKPPFNYSHIIGMVMLEKGRVTLQQICSWIESKFAYFRVRKKWNNSIRHNLSLHHCFRKINRSKFEKGKGGYWELGLDPKKCDRKRIRNRKVHQTKRNKMAEIPIEIAYEQPISDTYNSLIEEQEQIVNDYNEVNLETQEEIMLDDLNVQNTVDVTNCCYYNQQLEAQSFNEDDIIMRLLNSKNENNAKTCTNNCVTFSNSVENEKLQNSSNLKKYQLGTIIISTSPLDSNSSDAVATLNKIIGPRNKLLQQHFTMNPEFSGKSPFDNIIISSVGTGSAIETYPPVNTILSDEHQNANVVVEHVNPNSCTNAMPMQVRSIPWECTTIAKETLHPYIDGIEEAFQYLRSIDNTRNDDLLDNFFDISVSDY